MIIDTLLQPGKRLKSLLGLSLALVIFILVSWLLSIILPGGSTLLLTLQADHVDQAKFYWWNGKNPSGFTENNSDLSKKYSPHEKQIIQASASDKSLYRFRIDPGNSSGVYKIYNLDIHSHYSDPLSLSGKDMYDLFQPGHDQVSMAIDGDVLVVTALGSDPYIISKENLQSAGPLYRYILPLIFSILFYSFFVRSRIRLSEVASYKDIFKKNPSSGKNINSLDGLRGLAALTVVGDHSWGLFKGTGFSGVLIFFSLSGFLLAMPFIQDSSRALSLEYMVTYFKRRIYRIIPVYYLIITIYYCFDMKWDIAIRHFLFLQGDGHFWAIPQEMLFYLLLPFFVIVLHVLARQHVSLCLVFLMGCIFYSHYFLDQDVISLYGMMSQQLRAFIGIFLGGMFFSYLYFSDWIQSLVEKQNGLVLRNISSTVGILIIILFVFFSNSQLLGGSFVYAQHYFEVYGFLAALLVFCVAVAKDTILYRLMNICWLRAVGVVSLSLYLVHPSIIFMIREFSNQYFGIRLQDAPLFVCTVVISYVVACLSYNLIEKSVYGSGKTTKKSR
ncbi:MAG: acyltransferase [Bacteroidetes bacterium]|nr:acyltransferase [Bacteroidota bacterium]